MAKKKSAKKTTKKKTFKSSAAPHAFKRSTTGRDSPASDTTVRLTIMGWSRAADIVSRRRFDNFTEFSGATQTFRHEDLKNKRFFVNWMNASQAESVSLVLGLILDNEFNVHLLGNSPISLLQIELKRATKNLAQAERYKYVRRGDEAARNLSKFYKDFCDLFDLCNTLDFTKKIQKLDESVVDVIDERAQPFDGILKHVWENKKLYSTVYDGMNDFDKLKILLALHPYAMFLIVAFILSTKAMWEVCDCKKLRKNSVEKKPTKRKKPISI